MADAVLTEKTTAATTIRKLTGENYVTWSYQIKLILLESDLLSTVEPGETEPDETRVEEVRKYNSRQGRALAKICLTIGDEQQRHVQHLTSPKAVWDELERLYAPRDSKLRIIQLRRMLYSMKLTDHANMDAYLGSINHTVTKLTEIGDKLDDGDLGMLILCGLPEEWDTVVSAICNLPKEQFTSATVKHRLLAEHDRKTNNIYSKTASALLAKNSVARYQPDRQSNSKAKPKKQDLRCNFCGIKGHFYAECRSRLRAKHSAKTHRDTTQKEQQRKPSDKRCTDLMLVCGDSNHTSGRDVWVIDSGATHHMSSNSRYFTKLDNNVNGITHVTIADGTKTETTGRGSIHAVLPKNEGILREFTVQDVIMVPSIKHNVLSVQQMVQRGKRVVFDHEKCLIFDGDDNILIDAKKEGCLFVIETLPKVEQETYACYNVEENDRQSPLNLWHRRFMHVNKGTIVDMSKTEAVKGLDSIHENISPCDDCSQGKSHRQAFSRHDSGSHEALKPFDLVHSDLMGPFDVSSWGGARYVLTITDESTRYVYVYCLKNKSEALSKFQEWLIEVENQTPYKLRRIRTDNGLEFCSKAWENVCKSRGIVHERTMVFTPQQNAKAERLNRTLLDLVRATICASNLPKASWAELVSTAAYLRNRVVNKHDGERTPFELMYQKVPSVRHLRVIGCRAFVHIPKEKQRSKLEKRAEEGILIGYPRHGKGWRIWIPQGNKVVESRDCVFKEDEVPRTRNLVNLPSVTLEQTLDSDVTDDDSTVRSESVSTRPVQDSEDTETEHPQESAKEIRVKDKPQTPARTHPMVLRHMQPRPEDTDDSGDNSTREAEVNSVRACSSELAETPDSYESAIESPDAAQWIQAMTEELESLRQHETWELVPTPENVEVIKCRWVFVRKTDADGNIVRYKARLVAKGYNQRKGIDFDDVYSPVASFDTIRLLTAIAAENNWHLDQYDVKSAYLHGELDKILYMEQPPGFTQPGKETMCCKLKKSLYGLRQSGRCWNIWMDAKLKEVGFIRSTAEPCVYTLVKPEGIAIMAIYVDDILVTAENETVREQLKTLLNNAFECRYMGPVQSLLGVKFTRTTEGIWLTQESYIERLAERFGLQNAKGAHTPMEVRPNLSEQQSTSESSKRYPYLELIGSLMFLSQRTRPDIAYAVGHLSQFCATFNEKHWMAAKRITRYAKETKNFGLFYRRTGKPLIAYSDADWATCPLTRRSVTGIVTILGGSPITWRSVKQSVTALSSMEAEYIALSTCARDITWLRSLLTEMRQKDFIQDATTVNTDSQAAIAHAQNFIAKTRTKHIAIQFHYVREKVEEGVVKLQYTPTEDNVADIFTKSLPQVKHQYFLQRRLKSKDKSE